MKVILNILFVLLYGCQNNNTNLKQVSQNPNIDFRSVAYIELIKADKKNVITDTLLVKNIILNISNSKIEYIKFGSSQKIIFYDSSNKIIEWGFYRDKLIKINGIVYKLEEEIK